MGEEVGVDVRPPGQHCLARPFGAEQLGVAGLVHVADGFLPDVGRVADYGVHFLQGDAPLRVACEGYVVQRDTGLRVEEAGPGYAGVVRLVAQVADGEVDGG